MSSGRSTKARTAAGGALAVVVLAATMLAAAPARGEEAPEAPMAALADMVGTWKGEGWMSRGPEERHEFESTEIVESRLGGEVILVEGIHHEGTTGRKVHHALAMISWDPGDAVYRFRSMVVGRGPGDFEGRFEDGVFVWGGDVGHGEMRYRITIDGDRWSEIGEFSRDGGETWSPFFGMELRREPLGEEPDPDTSG